jgi:hypothetical protein
MLAKTAQAKTTPEKTEPRQMPAKTVKARAPAKGFQMGMAPDFLRWMASI